MSANSSSPRGRNTKGIILLAVVVLLVAAGAGVYWWKPWSKTGKEGVVGKPQPLAQVKTVKAPKDSYDVIVVGTDPEGVAAAVSAAKNGLSTLLLDGRNREILGGLMTLGWLNSLDNNYEPDRGTLHKREILNKGIFSEWYSKVEGDSFDVATAANVFNDLVAKQKNIDVLLKAKTMEPVLSKSGDQSTITGMKITQADGTVKTVQAGAVIDATQDADIAAASGVPFTFGREDLGDKKSKMAVTLVFRLKNITPDVWKQMQKRMETDNDDGTGANEMSVWGYKDMKDYPPINKDRVAMRGLNIGRQNNNTMLINALQIFGIDGTDPKSRDEAFELGKKELPHIVEYMKKKYPEFAGIELDATAPELYVRETRHIQGEYRLSILDVMENRDQWDRIAFGAYPIDIQRLSPADTGAVVGQPLQYAVPYRSIVPKKVDGLLVVGRAASFDTLPHGSARVVPVGMATGEAAGASVKLAKEQHLTFRQLSASKDAIATLQDTLNKQGMELKPFDLKTMGLPDANRAYKGWKTFMEHKSFKGLETALTLGLATGAYTNDFALDAKSNGQRMINQLEGMRKFRPEVLVGSPAAAVAKGTDPKALPVTLDLAAQMIAQLLKVDAKPGSAAETLLNKGILTQESIATIADKQELTNGDTYMLIRDVYNAEKAAK
ncbi:FAD-dependent oxidoreductase [Paenibacillus cremeus]|uniref:FAD-dependent oxidoreductase n=1 Tax=Paenibacillus cremeus TaxID=2163881 RepID=A0A559KIL7_9BACL|nr:FAD-dependent oxidoreductase [Paenibacillus cremeus]TVY11949.1 FAD-dependent oxidoreductase [Paenibacillus cremeus]